MSGYTLSKRDGSMLLSLPPPLRGMTPKPDLIGSVMTTGAGRRVLHRINVKRTWTLSWNRLPDATYRLIAAFHDGTHGPGSFLFASPDTDGQAVAVNVSDLDPSVDLVGFWNVRLTLMEV